MPIAKPKTVSEYIAASPKEAQLMLRELRALLKEIAPNSKEFMKWRAPVMEEKRILFSYSAHKTHLNFMPTRTTLVAFKKELAEYTTGKDTIQFPYDKPLPKTLIRKIAMYRAKDVRENDAKWMLTA